MRQLLSCRFKRYLTKSLIFVFLLFFLNPSFSQRDSLQQKNIKKVLLAETGLYVVSMTTLGSMWYSQFDKSHWHWFDDSGEWLQMDKMGHVFASYQCSKLAYEIHCYSGFSKKQSLLWSSLASFIAVGSVEIFDGFSEEWGASVSDLYANTLGVGLFALQQWLFDKQIVKIKYSYHYTNFYVHRPELLGKNHVERLVKDYNAQQFWLSVNLYDLFEWDFLPKFLNISVGYGATNMVSGRPEYSISQGFIPYRRFFISPDIDLEKIKTRSKFLRGTLKVLNAIKIPMPTVEFNKHKTKFMWLY